MLIDASVARSFAVIGWTRYLLQLAGGTILVADGVHGQQPEDPSELRSIRAALQRQADQATPGSGVASRALAAVHGIDELLALTLWTSLTSSPGYRTRDLLWQLVGNGTVEEVYARERYNMLQTDDLHNLGGPPW